MIRFRHFLVPLACAAALAGCARNTVYWEKPGATEDQWVVDRASCRSYARHESDDNYRVGGAADIDQAGGIDDGAQFRSLMDRHDAQRDAQAIYERCLMRKGYTKKKPGATPASKA
ncbi:MAG: hypothetical protein VW405_16045 [Rhodospirillaceae bacterium]